jgi:hypothetical protein
VTDVHPRVEQRAGIDVVRVGRKPDPLAFVPMQYQTWAGRFDDPDHLWRTLYTASDEHGAWVEVLGRFRAHPETQAALDEIVEEPDDAAAVRPEQQHPTDRGHRPSLMDGDQPQRLEIRSAQLSNRRERLGSRCEVDRFRVQLGHRLLVVGHTLRMGPSSPISWLSARRLVDPTRTYTPRSGPCWVRWCGRSPLGWTSTASTCDDRQLTISSSGMAASRIAHRRHL